MDRCLASLTSTQIYEASGNVFWLDVLGDKFGEWSIGDVGVTWHQLQAGASVWSEEAFVSSCEDPEYRRFVFPGYLPAAIANASHIQAMMKSKKCYFHKLCCLGGHSIIYAWYEALADAAGCGKPDWKGRRFQDLEVVRSRHDRIW